MGSRILGNINIKNEMVNIEELKDKLRKRIDKLPEEELIHASKILKAVEKKNSKNKILSFAGKWKDMDDDIFDDFIKNIGNRRKNNRIRF